MHSPGSMSLSGAPLASPALPTALLAVSIGALMGLVGCGERTAPTEAAPEPGVEARARPIAPPDESAPSEQAAPTDPRAERRARGFAEQDDLPRPAILPAALTAAWPAGLELKAVGFVVERGLRDGRWAPEHHAAAVSLLSPATGQAAQAALREVLLAQGWLTAGSPMPSVIERAERGELFWQIKDPAAWPTRIELRLDGPAARVEGFSKAAVEGLLGEVPPWLGAVPEPAAAGFVRRHVQRRGVLYSDTVRVSMAWSRADAPVWVETVGRVMRDAGWRVDDDDARIWRRSGGRSVLLIADAKRGVAYLHHDRRWTRPAPSAAPE